MNALLKIAGKITYALVVLLLLGVAGLFLSSFLKIPGSIELKIVKSGSMEPAIKTGSIVVIKAERSYAIGDVITFGEDSRTKIPTTHRIVAMNDENGQISYTTKGDANNAPDQGNTPASLVIGKVLLAVPYAGYILNFARTPVGFILLIVIPAGVIIIDELIHIVQEIAELRRERRIRRV